MIITLEISLYPLSKNFESSIIKFIECIRANEELEVFTNSMSSYVKGESTIVFNVINDAMKRINADEDTFSVVLKIINRDLPVGKGFLEF